MVCSDNIMSARLIPSCEQRMKRVIYKTDNIFSPRGRHIFSAITRCLSCQFSTHSDMCPAYCMASCDINKRRVAATCHSCEFNKRHVQAPRDIFPRLVPSCVPIFKNNQRTNVVLNEGLTFWNCEVIFHKRVRVYYQGLQTFENNENRSSVGLVIFFVHSCM